MANVAAQFGFQHIGYLPGYAPDMAPSRRMIQSSYATAIFYGDPVIKSASSPYIQVATSTSPLSGTNVAGIFYGCYQIPKGGSAPIFTPWFPGSVQADATAIVIDSPGALFRVAALATAFSTSNVGNNVGWSTGAGGTTFGAGFSTFTADQSLLTNNATAPFTIVDLWSNRAGGSTVNGADNTTNFNWIIVTFNNEAYRAGVAGIS